jgi:hypothetical protein
MDVGSAGEMIIAVLRGGRTSCNEVAARIFGGSENVKRKWPKPERSSV